MIRKEWFRPKKLRVLMAWIAAPVLLFYSNLNGTSFFWGAALMIAGELIRCWSLGFVEKKGWKLAMSGPYALTRNPLYVGNFFLGLGLVVIAANWIFVALFFIGFTFIYLGTIRGEEKELLERFGATYENYCKNVPRLFPRFTPSKAPEPNSFDWNRIVMHHEYVTALGIALLLCGIRLYYTLFLQKEPLGSQAGLIVIFIILSAALVFERLFISDFKRMFAEGLPNLFLKKK